MKKILSGCLAGVIGATALFGAAACAGKSPEADKEALMFSDPAATFTVDAEVDKSNSRKKISDDLFGVFLEDINYASYALDDNLVVNGSFEALSGSGKDYGWSALTGATLKIENTDGIFPAESDYAKKGVNPNYAKVTVSAAGGGIVNQGYSAQEVPMAVASGVKYKLSAFIKAPAAAKMTVKVTDGTKDYLSGEVEVLQDSSWVKYTRTFEATATGNNLKLQLAFDKAGDYYLDAVTLETSDSTIGIKNYIYEAIKDLSPKFIRFPGGCVIEGRNMTDAYDWKNSIGAVQNGANAGDDIVPAFSYKVNEDGTTKQGEATYGEPATRKPNIDIWYSGYYDMEYALGFYEYFLLCDSIGASAVPVLNCGYADMGGLGAGVADKRLPGRHDKYIEDYIQDAIDLVEFAQGDTSTKWGKIRSDLGHPEPFKMSYLGIGNEQTGVYYTDYYEKFLEDEDFMATIKKYGVETIVGNAMHFIDCENSNGNGNLGTAQAAAMEYRGKHPGMTNLSDYGVHDQHYYVNYTTLFTHTDMYERYEISGEDAYKVFVGEYSANEAVAGFAQSNNEWVTALSEAAMMTGYEKNGSVVVLAAYAPMFAPVKANARQWGTDMMYFTSTQLVRSTNYYVQQIFMKNQGSYLPKTASLKFAKGGSTYDLIGSDNTSKSTIERLYYVASVTEEGDVIIKLVNPTDSAIQINVEINNAKLQGYGEVTILQNADLNAKNTLENIDDPAIAPESYSIGFKKTSFGYEAPAGSVTAIRLLAK